MATSGTARIQFQMLYATLTEFESRYDEFGERRDDVPGREPLDSAGNGSVQGFGSQMTLGRRPCATPVSTAL